MLCKYTYDAWGKHTITDAQGKAVTAENIGNKNPYRYRGYYYDTEFGLYYLQSRYYDPETGRFINADDVSYLDPQTIGGLNLFAYCNNNPMMYTDPLGTSIQNMLTFFEYIFTGFSFVYKNFAQMVQGFRKVPRGWSKRQFHRWKNEAINESNQMKNSIGKIALFLSLATLTINIGVSWYENYKSGSASWFSDSIVDTLYIGARFALGYGITALFSFIPGIGPFLGIGVSLAVDCFITWVMDEGTNALNDIKNWAAQVGSSIKSWWNGVKRWWNSLWA